MTQAEITRAVKAVRAAGETVYAVRMSWREIDGRSVMEAEIVTQQTETTEPGKVILG